MENLLEESYIRSLLTPEGHLALGYLLGALARIPRLAQSRRPGDRLFQQITFRSALHI
jgi:hypothetical protein